MHTHLMKQRPQKLNSPKAPPLSPSQILTGIRIPLVSPKQQTSTIPLKSHRKHSSPTKITFCSPQSDSDDSKFQDKSRRYATEVIISDLSTTSKASGPSCLLKKFPRESSNQLTPDQYHSSQYGIMGSRVNQTYLNSETGKNNTKIYACIKQNQETMNLASLNAVRSLTHINQQSYVKQSQIKQSPRSPLRPLESCRNSKNRNGKNKNPLLQSIYHDEYGFFQPTAKLSTKKSSSPAQDKSSQKWELRKFKEQIDRLRINQNYLLQSFEDEILDLRLDILRRSEREMEVYHQIQQFKRTLQSDLSKSNIQHLASLVKKQTHFCELQKRSEVYVTPIFARDKLGLASPVLYNKSKYTKYQTHSSEKKKNQRKYFARVDSCEYLSHRALVFEEEFVLPKILKTRARQSNQ